MMDSEPWYSARCIFRHRLAVDRPSTYEERIILIRAESFEHATQRAEEYAHAYANSIEGVEYLKFVDVYHLFDDSVGDGSELFSSLRDSDLAPDSYLSRFFDTGSEYTRRIEST